MIDQTYGLIFNVLNYSFMVLLSSKNGRLMSPTNQ